MNAAYHTEASTDGQEVATVDLPEEIARLKKELNAVILAHYYQESEIQDVADFIGDSLDLSRRAASTDADVIVFAGVHFMAETAKILSPTKQVLLPDLEAGCSLAEGCPAPGFRAFRAEHPDHTSITYINCSAEVKAASDIVCTSSSAEKIISQIPEDKPIFFAPDRNLGKYLVKKTGRNMLLWEGSCIVHETFSMRKLIHLQLEHPDAELIAHPECEEPILEFTSCPTDPEQWAPRGELNRYILGSGKSIASITVEQVVGAAREMLRFYSIAPVERGN